MRGRGLEIAGRLAALLSLGILLLFPAACGPREVKPDPRHEVPVRLLRVTNPDLPSFTNSQVEIFLAEAQRFVASQLGIHIRWIDLGEMDTAEFFRRYYPIVFPENRTEDPYVLDIIEPNIAHAKRLTDALISANKDHSYEELYSFSEGVLPAKRLELAINKEALLAQIAQYHLEQLSILAALPSPNNPQKPLLNPDLPFHQYVYWDAALERVRRYDFILTNQLLASAETLDASIHASLRGGITTGFTEKSHALYGGSIVLSTYPLIGTEEPFTVMRGGDYTPQEAARFLGAYSAHEFGHLFLHIGHPYDHPACVMNPARSLRYREWYVAIEQAPTTPSCREPHTHPYKDVFLGGRPWSEKAKNSVLRLWDRLTGS